MSIRLRSVNGVRVALCAVETDQKSGDIYLDDADHYALAQKFAEDWKEHHPYNDGGDPVVVAAMATQKIRDAWEVFAKWEEDGRPCGMCGRKLVP